MTESKVTKGINEDKSYIYPKDSNSDEVGIHSFISLMVEKTHVV